ncbi:MAG: TatD family nuclease-associated radical SAM protein [Anaerovoracaceae bacterium]|jgi:TatD family-associated radical SAM protein
MENSSIIYSYGGGIYINLTNRCSNRCEFCIRTMTDGLGDADSLWLEREPTVDEVIEELKEWPLAERGEVIFCGYGEPTERLDAVLDICRWIKGSSDLSAVRTRINTNGQADLINGRETCGELDGLVDAVSVSLNQCTAEKYQDLCHSRYGEAAYPAVLKYIDDLKRHVPEVAVSAVGCIGREDMLKCREIAREKNVIFRSR